MAAQKKRFVAFLNSDMIPWAWKQNLMSTWWNWVSQKSYSIKVKEKIMKN